MCIRFHTFISGPGREADDISTLCPQMGAVTLFRAVDTALPAALRCLKGLSLKQFSLPVPREEKLPRDVNLTAAINNGIETEGVRAVLESFSPDRCHWRVHFLSSALFGILVT